MANPWLSIPLCDYEAHMGSAEVRQLGALSELFAEALRRCRPESAAIGAPETVMLSGVFCAAGAAWFWSRMGALRRVMRPIYESLGIIPAEVTAVLQDAGGN
jgi:hypothetical protein